MHVAARPDRAARMTQFTPRFGDLTKQCDAAASWTAQSSTGTIGRMRPLVMTIVFALAVAICGSARTDPTASPQASGLGVRILFIGNSLTTTNDLPAMIERLGRDGGLPIVTRTVAEGGFSLEDHWNHGAAQRVIAEGGWSVVVLQQGPSALAESQANLRDYARRFDREIRKVGARPALYMVWPESKRSHVFDDVALSYTRAAAAVNGLLYPVGEAWRAAWRRDRTLALYGADGFHPSRLGTGLAALVMYQQISGRSVIGLGSPLSSIDPATMRLLQEAAAEANARVAALEKRAPPDSELTGDQEITRLFPVARRLLIS